MQYIYRKITNNPTTSLVIGAALLMLVIYLFEERSIEEKIKDRFRAYKMMPEGDFRATLQQRADDRGRSYEKQAFVSAIYDLKRKSAIPTDRSYTFDDYKDA